MNFKLPAFHMISKQVVLVGLLVFFLLIVVLYFLKSVQEGAENMSHVNEDEDKNKDEDEDEDEANVEGLDTKTPQPTQKILQSTPQTPQSAQKKPQKPQKKTNKK